MLHSLGLKIEKIAKIVSCQEEVISAIMKNLEARPQKNITPRFFNADAAVIALHLHHYGCSLDTIVKLLESASFEFEEVELITMFWCRRIIPHTENKFKTRSEDALVSSNHSCSTIKPRPENAPVLPEDAFVWPEEKHTLSSHELELMMELGQLM